MKHELTHINQRHWIDLLCSECMLLLQWFNPLAWVYVRLLKENHEFLADKAVLDSGASPRVYQAVLINQEFQGPIFSFANSFNYSKPLNRLSMMKKEKSASWKRLAALAIVPMFGLFLWASAKPNYIMKDLPIDPQMENSLVIDTVKPGENKTSVLTVKEGNPKDDLSSFLRKDDLEKALIIVDGQKGVKLEDVKAEEIVGVEVLKGEQSIEKYGEEGKNGVVFVTTGANHVTDKMKDRAHSVNTSTQIEVSGKPSKRLQGTVVSIKNKEERWISDKDFREEIEDALVFVDDKEVEKLDDIALENIESISILKDKAAIEKYGEEGSKGVVHVKMRKPGVKSALIIVDGKKVDNMDTLKPEDVESMNVLKDKAATDKYGEEGKNGVILIEMKKK